MNPQHSRRRFLRLVGSGAVLASMAPCPAQVVGQDNRRTVDFLHMSVASIEEPFSGALQTLAEEFEAETGTVINNLASDWSVGFDRVRAAAIAGNELDLAQVGAPWPAELRSIGAFAPLDLDDFGGANAFIEPARATAVIDEQAWALPFAIDTRALIYRRDALDEIGHPVPGTLDELQQTALALSRDSEHVEFGVGLPGADPVTTHNFAMLLWAHDGEIVDSPLDDALVRFHGESGQAALSYWVDLMRSGAMPLDSAEWNLQQQLSAMLNGRIGMTFGFPFEVPIYQNAFGAENVGVAILPRGPEAQAVLVAGSHLMLFQDAPAEATLAWMRWLLDPEHHRTILRAINNLSPRLKTNALLVEELPHMAPFAEGVERFGRALPLGWGVIEAILQRALSNVLGRVATGTFQDGKTVPEALSAAARQIEQALRETFE